MDKSKVRAWLADARNRPPDLEAWAEFIATLRGIGQSENDGHADPRLPPGLTGPAAAVLAVLTLLDAHPHAKAERLGIPFAQLATAIAESASGRRPALFEPVGQPKGRKSIAAQNTAGVCARALDELIAAGQPADQAARAVAAAARAGRVAGHSKITAALVQQWRYRLREGDRDNGGDVALARFHTDLPPEAGTTHAERGKYLLTVLRGAAVLRV